MPDLAANLSANKAVAQSWYDTLAAGDIEAWQALHAPDCHYNISGHTIISGRVDMVQLMSEILPAVFGNLDLDNFRFCTRQRLLAAEGDIVIGMMEADGPANNGVRYDQRYVHIFRVRDGKLVEVTEFFDTELAQRALFADVPEASVPNINRAFEFPGAGS